MCNGDWRPIERNKMNNKRKVYYETDGNVRILVPAQNCRRVNESDTDLFNRIVADAERKDPSLVSMDSEEKDVRDFPVGYDNSNREKLRGEKGQPLRIDNTVVTQAEKRKTVEDELDAELAKQSPSAVKAIKLNRKLEKKDY